MRKILQNHYRDRPLTPRGRNQAAVRSPRGNGRVSVIPSPDSNFPERSSREFAPSQPHVHQGGGRAGVSDVDHSGSPEKRTQPVANVSMHPVDKGVDFVSVGSPQNTVLGPDQERY